MEKENWINYKLKNGQTIKENLEETLNKYLHQEISEDSQTKLVSEFREYFSSLENIHIKEE